MINRIGRWIILWLSIGLFSITLCAQEREPRGVTSCLGDVTEPILELWHGWRIATFTTEHWRALGQIEGENIWQGYKNGGFNVPDDVYPLFRLRGIGEREQPIEVWMWRAPSMPDVIFWFAFENTELYGYYNGAICTFPSGTNPCVDDAGNYTLGEHFGIHPCGAYVVSYDDFFDWLGQANGMD